MGADDERRDLDALNARVFEALPRSARRSDGAWEMRDVSASLHQLHASLKQQVAAQEAELNDVETHIATLHAQAPAEAQTTQSRVVGIASEADKLLPAVDAAVEHFEQLSAVIEPAAKRLGTLEARAKYLETAVEVEKHSQEARASAVEATEAALEAFKAFSAYVQTIPMEYRALRTEAVRRVEELSFGIKQYAVEKLQKALAAVEWPRVHTREEIHRESDKFQAIAKAFAYLLTLHVSQLDADTSDTSTRDALLVELWAMECVLEPVRMRFRYHFERAESKTNRVTKPEWFLSHVLEQTRSHSAFLTTIVTPELRKLRPLLACVDAQVLFVRGLILTASKKLRKDLPAIVSERAVFCHTIDEVLLFEQVVNDEFGYESYNASKPLQFPRVVDVLTSDPKTLFQWTTIDLQYAKSTLNDAISTAKNAWSSESSGTPMAAQQFMALLDFMCRRFAHFSNEGHRYVYISQVHFALLREFKRACDTRARRLDIGTLLERQRPLSNVFGVVNAVQHVVNVLQAWDENSFFIELMRKVAESDKSRVKILKMHLEHSKALLKNAAKAATETIMAREEAVAVRQAIAGPGAMIGPTAAFTAAYSVGSKTVKSLFGRTDEEAARQSPTIEPQASSESAAVVDAEKVAADQAAADAEALLFSRTMFEKQIVEYRSLVSAILEGVQNAVVGSVRRSLYAYRESPSWRKKSVTERVQTDVSSELGSAVELLRRVLTEARCAVLSEECFSQLWKPLMSSLDDAIYTTANSVFTVAGAGSAGSGFSLSSAATAIGAVEPASTESTSSGRASWSDPARTQFVIDVNAFASVFQASCTKNPRAYLRKTFDLCRLVEMAPSKLTEIHEALRGVDDEHTASGVPAVAMEQITTILEACSILTLTPRQVQAFCETQLGLQ